MPKPEFTRAALKDLAEIVEYVGRDKPTAALNLIEKIETKCFLVANSPEMGPLHPSLGTGIRSTLVGRYVIYYRVHTDQVEILRVIAGERDVRSL